MNLLKRTLILAALVLLFPLAAGSQVIISSFDLWKPTSYSIEAEVVDSLSNEPITFASVYVKNVKDTIINAFALTDTLGKVKLTEVTTGEYDFFVEYLGYKMYRKTIYVRKSMTLPKILLQEDKRVLEAAKVSAVGTAVEFKQDTIVYNASSFRSLAGDNLSDLLKKMPGIEVSESGEVKVNGKAVSKITVNGKTFFMGDNKAALDNLPAHFVDKVKVIDKEEDEAAFTGIKVAEKEKVMDVELKEEYKKGFFGNVKMAGGASAVGKNAGEFLDNSRLLYDGSTMMSAYGEENQLTVVGNAKNVVSDMVTVFMVGGGSAGEDLSLGFGGLQSNWSAGANLNTDKVKGMKVNVSSMYNNQSVRKHSRTDRTTFMEGDDNLNDVSDATGSGNLQSANIKLEMEKKDRSKYTFVFRPTFSYKNLNESSRTVSSSKMGDIEKNSTDALTTSFAELYTANGNMTLGAKDFGKTRRALTFVTDYSLQAKDGYKDDISTTVYSNETVDRNIHYINDLDFKYISGQLTYVEPFGENWALRTLLSANASLRNNSSDAFNPDGTVNDYFTSITDNRTVRYRGNLLGQYSKGSTTLQFGGVYETVKNEVYARSYGLDSKTGYGEWQNTLSPYLNLNYHGKKGISGYVSLTSYVSNPSASNLIPTFNLMDPTRVSFGNIFLEPSVSNYLYTSLGGKAGKVMLNIYANASLNSNQVISAVWFDENSVRYSMPVNSRKPSSSAYLNGSISVPLNEDQTVTVSYSPSFRHNNSVSYQAQGALDGVDIDAFDYSSFIGRFWGNDSGDIFYSGASGFRESLTKQYSINNRLSLRMNYERFNMTVDLSAKNSKSNYSLDPRANTNVWDNGISLYPNYTTPHDFEISGILYYRIRRGYGAAYDENYGDIDLRITKNFKAFSVGLIGSSLLNQARNFTHTVNENYYQDSYSLVMGRRIMLSFTYNFGKMNAANSSAASSASRRIML